MGEKRPERLTNLFSSRHESSVISADVDPGLCYRTLGDIPKAIKHHERSLAMNEKLGSIAGQADNIGNLGLCYETLGDIPRAIEHHERSLAMNEKLGSIEGQADQLARLGACYQELSDTPKAIELLERSLELFRRMGIPEGDPRVSSLREALDAAASRRGT